MSIKKIAITISILVSTLTFSAQSNYKLTKAKSVTKTQSQVNSELVEFERIIRKINVDEISSEVKKYTLQNVPSTSANKKFADILSGVIREIRNKDKITFNTVEYKSDNEVKISYTIKIPNIDIFSKEIDGEVDRRLAKKGIDSSTKAMQKMSDKEILKLLIQAEPIWKEVVREKLNSPNLKYTTEKVTAILKKQNGKWVLIEQY